jgi:hypothetical protein
MPELVCDKCSGAITADSRFCPHCGDPVTDADRPASIVPAGCERVKLVCPKCESQAIYGVDLMSLRVDLTWPKCSTTFQTRLAVVRAKRSSGSKKENRRNFSVRVQNFAGWEDLIEFTNAGTDDFELRSRDISAFSYLNG